MLDYLSISARRPETRILAAISGLWMSRLIGFASKVGLFEAIAAGSAQARDIAAAKGLAEGPLARALEGLVHLGLARREGGVFSLTEDGRLMLPEASGGFQDLAALWRDLFDGAWAALLYATGSRFSPASDATPMPRGISTGPCAAFRN